MTERDGTSRGTGAAAFIGAVYAFALGMLGTTMPTPIYPIYREVFGFSQLMITVIFAVYALGVLGALLLTGRWSDGLGRRPMMLAAMALSAVSDLAFIAADRTGTILAARVLSGLSAGILTGTATVALMELAPERWRNVAGLAATAANMGGLGLGPIFAGAVITLLPYPMVMPFVLHALLLLLAILAILRAPETVTPRPERPSLAPQGLDLPPEVRGIFVPAAIAAFSGFMVFGFFTAMAPAFLAGVMGVEGPLTVGVIVGALFICSTLGQAMQPRLPEGGRLRLGTLLLLGGVTLLGLGFLTASLFWLLPGVAVAGAGQGIAFRSGLGDVAAASPDGRRAGVVSSYFVVAYVAISLPVVGVGLVSGTLGLQRTGEAFALLVGLLLLGALAMLARVRPGQR